MILLYTILLDHFLVNNWANGWRLNVGSKMPEVGSENLQTSNLQPPTSNIVIIFWPLSFTTSFAKATKVKKVTEG